MNYFLLVAALVLLITYAVIGSESALITAILLMLTFEYLERKRSNSKN